MSYCLRTVCAWGQMRLYYGVGNDTNVMPGECNKKEGLGSPLIVIYEPFEISLMPTSYPFPTTSSDWY